MELSLIWHVTTTLSVLSMLMYALLVLRRGWHEYRLKVNLVARRHAERKVFHLLELEHGEFCEQLAAGGYFTQEEIKHINALCLALCQVIKGADKDRVVAILLHTGFDRGALRDLRRGSEDYRHAAVIALQYFDDAQVTDALLDALDDPSDEVCLSAVLSLQARNALPHLDVVLQQLTERKVLQRAECRHLFRQIAVQAPAQLVRLEKIRPANARIRALTAEAMGSASDYSVLPGLQRLAADPEPEVRIKAMESLCRLEHPGSAQTVLARLKDRYWEVRNAAVIAAGELGLEDAIGQLEELLDSDNWILRFNAALALFKMGVIGRRVLLRKARRADAAGRMANLVLDEKGISSLLPGW